MCHAEAAVKFKDFINGFNNFREKYLMHSKRKKIISEVGQVVIKVGTRLLTDTAVIPSLIKQISFLRERNIRVLLVSSGAVGMGLKTTGMKKRSNKLSEVQALAALGQSRLVALYDKECVKYGFHAAQMLLSAEDLRNRKRHINAMNCIHSLWALGHLPIINENDSVSVDELKLGDNDTLAAMLAVMTRSDLTILLTTVDGLRAVDQSGALAERIPEVSVITSDMRKLAKGTDGNAFSIGGMKTKIKAAEMITNAGEYMIIADGREEDIVRRIFNGDDVGTLFLPVTDKRMHSKKRWLNFFSKASGDIIVDEGAAKAVSGSGCSLLPSGITGINGRFSRGDTVNIVTEDGDVIAKGLTNYSSSELHKIAGRQTADINSILGAGADRSEERRVGKECRSRWSPYH